MVGWGLRVPAAFPESLFCKIMGAPTYFRSTRSLLPFPFSSLETELGNQLRLNQWFSTRIDFALPKTFGGIW